MAKRFIDTTIWTQNKWFRRLEPKYKLLWFYLISNCDPVGVWEEDLELVSFIVKEDYEINEVLSVFGARIKVFADGKKWWLVDFCNFQYGTLDEAAVKNKPHQSYIKMLKYHSLWIDYTKTIDRLSNSPKEKEKDKDKEKEEFYDTDSIIDYFNEKLGSTYRHSKASRENIHARLEDGYSVEDCKLIIDFKICDWLGGDHEQYLRPSTLFRPKHIEGYLFAAQRWDKAGRPGKGKNGQKPLFEFEKGDRQYPEGREI